MKTLYKHCGTPMLRVIGGPVTCVMCGHVLKGRCECPGCTGGEIPKAEHWLCTDCYRFEPVRLDTEGGRFVWHSCPRFKGKMGERREVEATCGAKVTLFPSDEDPPDLDFPEGLMRKKLKDLEDGDEK